MAVDTCGRRVTGGVPHRSAEGVSMMRILATLLVGASVAIQADQSIRPTNRRMNPVVEWNRALLSIVRTPGAQPRTIHSTRSFAMLHAAVYDAVNAIRPTHTPY